MYTSESRMNLHALRAEEPEARLDQASVAANECEGFWSPIETLKDQHRLDQVVDSGNGPRQLWELNREVAGTEPCSLESPLERA